MKSWLFGAALALVALACDAEGADNPLIGRWLAQRVGVRAKFPFKLEWEFTKDEVIVRNLSSSEEFSRNKYTIDSSKEPKWITVTIIDQVKEIRPGIFRIVGDELHLKQDVTGAGRPAQFGKDDFSIFKRQAQVKGRAKGRMPKT